MMRTSFFKLTLLIIFSFSQAFAQSPKEVLNNSNEACKNLQSIHYRSSIEMQGVSIEAEVVQSKANVENVGFGKSRVKVMGIRTIGDESQEFAFSYDGRMFKFSEKGNEEVKTIENPDQRAVGRTLGFHYYMIVQSVFGSESGMDLIINDASNLEFVQSDDVFSDFERGIAITREFINPATKQRKASTSVWYIDEETNLPLGFSSKGLVKKMQVISMNDKRDFVFDINARGNKTESLITGNEPKTEGLPLKGVTFPEFELKDINGVNNTLKTLEAKIYLIDFWGTWCGPCLLAMPNLQMLHEKYYEKGLRVIGISVFDKPGKAEKYISKKGYNYTFLIGGEALASSIGLDTYPTVFILDAEGKIIHAEKGNRTGAKVHFESIITEYLDINQ